MPGLVLRNISKSFGTLKVLDDISLELAEGELLVLLGPSGCGKSTLLRLIAGLETLDSGEIYLNDRRIDGLLPKDRQVAMVFQNYALYPHMTVEKNLAFPLKVAGMRKDEINHRVSQVAQMLGLSDKLKNKPGQLSGGQRQRVALGRSVIRRPAVFLLDEPLSNLDADLRARMRREIVKIQREVQTTAVHVTHDQEEALTMADRIALLHQGRLIQVGTPEELYRKPNCLFASQFIGSPTINVIEGTIDKGVLMPFAISVKENNSLGSRPGVVIGLRPEHVRIVAGGEYKAQVHSCEYLGEQYVVTLSYNSRKVVVSGCKAPFEIGHTVSFDIDQAGLLFFDPDSQKAIA